MKSANTPLVNSLFAVASNIKLDLSALHKPSQNFSVNLVI
jgi:hypothetical protein